MEKPSDPMELIIFEALVSANMDFQMDFGGSNPSGLDFRLANGVEIEVKRFHSDRIGEQMKRADNVIVAQGEEAIRMLTGCGKPRLRHKIRILQSNPHEARKPHQATDVQGTGERISTQPQVSEQVTRNAAHLYVRHPPHD